MTMLIERAEAAQRESDWPRAAALWREAAEAFTSASERERHLQQAAWCDDMANLIAEPEARA